MLERPSLHKRIANEQTARKFNHQLLSRAEGFFEAIPASNVGFNCECDVERCDAVLQMAAGTYKGLHQPANRFVVQPGHERLDIEKVVDRYYGFLVVEKFDLAA